MAISTQSKPLMPGRRYQAIRKKIIVNGAKRAKRRGQTQALNAEPNRPGLIIHQTSIARRGPKRIKIVVAQHILFLTHQVFSYLIMAKTTIIIKKTIKMKKRIFRIPKPALAAPLKPKIPENIISTTAIIAKIQKILIFYSFHGFFIKYWVNRFIID